MASAVSTAEGPGTAVTRTPGLVGGRNQAVAGVGDRRHARVGDDQHAAARTEGVEQLRRTRGLVGVEVRDHSTGELDAQVTDQATQPPGVLGCDDVGARQRLAQPRGGVRGVADRRAGEHQHPRPCGLSRTRHAGGLVCRSPRRVGVVAGLRAHVPTVG